MAISDLLELIGLVVSFLHFLGVLSAVHAVMRSRTSQGAIAWVILLILFPYVTLPLYWTLGRNKFHGYVNARREGDSEIHHVAESLRKYGPKFTATAPGGQAGVSALQQLAKMPFTHSNSATLLIDGKETFDAIFKGIDSAERYILVQFFIVKDDRIGQELKTRLCRKAREGVRVYLLYDEIGSHKLSNKYVHELEQAGADVRAFRSSPGKWNRLQLNFRNHRKIVIVDGRIGYAGGLNVGDEYLGEDAKIGPWRDTHVSFEGPSVQCTQLAFMEDWYWVTQQVPDLCWEPQPSDGQDKKVLVLPSGPADALETCGLMFVHCINRAKKRFWIASPYFVPNSQVMCALQLAALRGVDVRVMLPQKPDHLLVYLSGFSYIEEAEPAGVKIYRYQPGFLHQKVMLVDDELAGVGTANLDNRSIRLNFEITLLFADREFAAEVSEMLERDFANSQLVTIDDFQSRPFWFRLCVRLSRLMAPIQ